MRATLIRLIAPAFAPLLLLPLLSLLLPDGSLGSLLSGLLTGAAVLGVLTWRIHKHFIRPARAFRLHLASLRVEPINFSKRLTWPPAPTGKAAASTSMLCWKSWTTSSPRYWARVHG